MRRLVLVSLLIAGCGSQDGAAPPAATPDPIAAARQVCEQHRAAVSEVVAEKVERSRTAAVRATLPILRRSYGRLRRLVPELAARADDSLPILARAARRRLTRAELRELRAIARDTRPLAERLGLRACMA